MSSRYDRNWFGVPLKHPRPPKHWWSLPVSPRKAKRRSSPFMWRPENKRYDSSGSERKLSTLLWCNTYTRPTR